MILALDMGNTNIVIGCIDSQKTYFVERVTTDHAKTGTEYAINIKNILEIHQITPADIEGAIMSSVVPPLNAAISSAVKKILGYHPMLVGAGIKTGMNIIMDNPKTVGSDMIVDAVAAIREYPGPIIIIDMGTATTMSVVDKNGNYIGGIIYPGLRVSLDSLSSKTAQLPSISLDIPKRVIVRQCRHDRRHPGAYGRRAGRTGYHHCYRRSLPLRGSALQTQNHL